MQRQRLLLFVLLTFAFLMTWSVIQTRWGSKKRPPQKPVAEQPADEKIDRWAFAEARPAKREAEEVKPKPEEAKPKPEEAKPKPEIPEVVTLGGDDFNLKVALTSQGGAVQSVVLNKFEEANRLGRPEEPPQNLHLVPDHSEEPSYSLFHYTDPKATNVRPVDALGKRGWKMLRREKGKEADEEDKIVFTTDVPEQGVTVTKTYTLKKGDYHLGLEVRLERMPGYADAASFRYQLAGAHGLPIEGDWYTFTYRNALIGRLDSRGNVWRDLQESRAIGIQEGGREVLRDEEKYISYAGVVTQYFASMIVVDDRQAEGVKPNFLAWARPTLERSNEKKPYLSDITARVISEPIELKPGKPVTHRYLLYNGPVKVRLLAQLGGEKAVSPDLVHRYEETLHLDTLTDYHSPNAFGNFASAIGWSRLLILCTNLMHGLLELLHKLVPSYGLCIILLTIVVRGAMFPLSRKQAISSARMQEKMQELAPEIKKLEEKYKGDSSALHQAKNELFLKRGINPLAMMGSCWMVFLQMPIFLGLYYALQESIHFRLASFLWMPNLAAPDMLVRWGENIAWISRPEDQGGFFYLGPYLNILPVFAVVLMILQQKITMPPPTDEQQAMQQKMMTWMMVFFGLMFYKMAAGLCIYFIASSLWGLAERRFLPKREAKPEAALEAAGAPGRRSPSAPRSKGRRDEKDGEGFVQKIKDWWADVLKQASKK